MLAVRRDRSLGTGALTLIDLGHDIVAFDVTTTAGTTRVVLNLGQKPWPLPAGSRILAASTPLTQNLHTDAAVWLAL